MKAELEALIEQMINCGIFFEEAVKEFEKKFIMNTLSRHNNNLSKAATALGIHRNTLSKRLLEYQTGIKNNGIGHANGRPLASSRDGHKTKTTVKRRPAASRTKARS